MGIEGLRFVITGSATGIGAATARVAASKGAKVMVSDLSDEQGQAVADEINASGGTAAYTHCDVTDTDQVEALMAATAEAYGGIDVLHNNAGIHESGLAPRRPVQSGADVPRRVQEGSGGQRGSTLDLLEGGAPLPQGERLAVNRQRGIHRRAIGLSRTTRPTAHPRAVSGCKPRTWRWTWPRWGSGSIATAPPPSPPTWSPTS